MMRGRLKRSFIMVLVMLVIWIAVDTLILGVVHLEKPFPGFFIDGHGVVGYVHLPWWEGYQSGLRFGDTVLDDGDRDELYRVRQGRTERLIKIPGSVLKSYDLVLAMGAPWLAGIMLLLGGSVLLFGIRGRGSLRSMGFLLCTGAVFMVTTFDDCTTHRYTWLREYVSWVMPLLALYLVLSFPAARNWLKRSRQWIFASIILVPALVTAGSIILTDSGPAGLSREWSVRFALLFLASMIALISSLTAHSLPERRQAGAVFWGVTIPFTIPCGLAMMHYLGLEPFLSTAMVFYTIVVALIIGGVMTFVYLLRPNYLVYRFQMPGKHPEDFYRKMFTLFRDTETFQDQLRGLISLITEKYEAIGGVVNLRSGTVEADSPEYQALNAKISPEVFLTLWDKAESDPAPFAPADPIPGIALCVPLQMDHTVEGLLLLGARRGRWGYSPEEISEIHAVANQVAIALDRRRALDELARHSRELESSVEEKTEALRETTGQLKTVMDEKETMQSRIVDLEVDYRLLEKRIADAPLAGIITNAAVMRGIIDETRKLAASNAGILITGEPGTGKDLIARAVHRLSSRSDKPFVHVNCAAIPDTLFESELFGHEPGAFTGAGEKRKIGLFEQAGSGTLFLDEIGDLGSAAQAKLLRAIQDKTIRRLGSSEEITVDVRLIAATNHDLNHGVETGDFRADLLSRLQVGLVHLPPLWDRRGDTRLLAIHFYSHFCQEENKTLLGFTRDALDMICTTRFPNNIRDLQNTIWRAVIRAPEETHIDIEHLTLPGENGSGTDGLPREKPVAPVRGKRLSISREALQRLLAECNGNRSEAARRLGVTRQTIWLKIKQFGI